MVQIEYTNSFNHNYIRIKIENCLGDRQRYQYKILENKRLEGLLPSSIYTSNGEQSIYYEISSMQSLSKWFIKEKIGEKWMDSLTAGLRVVLWSLEEYLLDNRCLLLRPDCIFLDFETGKLYFMYYPYYTEKNKFTIQTLLSFLTENVNEEEEDTVEAVYDIYSVWEKTKETFSIETFLSLWEKHQKEKMEAMNNNCNENITPVVKQEEKAGPSEKGKRMDIATIFSKNKYFKEENKISLAMEQWEYKAEKITEEPKEEGKTTYLEVKPESEERKLYGNGKQNRKVICLQKLPIVIGKKGDKADVVLQDSSISRMHARLTEQDGQVYLEDLNATNGTFKNGVRLQPYEKVEILSEDEIRLGKLSFTYR